MIQDFQIDKNLKNKFKSKKKGIFEVLFAARTTRQAKKTTYHTITFQPCCQSYEVCWALKIHLKKMLCENFKEKK